MAKQNNGSEEEVMEQLQALGYIDPGAGSSTFQLALGGFFNALRAAKSFFRKLFRLRRSGEFEERER